MVGSTNAFIIEYTYTDSVCTFGLEQKKAIKKSSKDNVKPKSPDATKDGINSGIITRQKV